MAPLDDEEEKHLATLNALEAVQEEISNYQGLLKDLPEIYERKFNERLKPVLDRQQSLIDERDQLLQQLRETLPVVDTETRSRLPPAPNPLPAINTEEPPRQPQRGRPWWLLGLTALGLTIGFHLKPPSPAPTPRPLQPTLSPEAPAPLPHQRSTQTSSVAAATPRERVVQSAMAEWTFFDQPTLRNGTLLRTGRKEGDVPQWRRVLTYWREGLANSSVADRAAVISPDHPWSAAFLAYVMKKAGVGDQVPSAASHSGRIKEAIYNRYHPAEASQLIGHRVSDYSPRPGDLLCATRSWATGQVSYDNANRFDFFPSRCEVVVSTSSAQILTIGGDLMDSVTLHTINAINGRVAPESARNWLVAIETPID
jgi:hypothetical protein